MRELHPSNMTPMAEKNWTDAIVLLQQALDHTPDTGTMVGHVGDANKMVRLTDDDIKSICDKYGITKVAVSIGFANAIMDAMIKKNGGQS